MLLLLEARMPLQVQVVHAPAHPAHLLLLHELLHRLRVVLPVLWRRMRKCSPHHRVEGPGGRCRPHGPAWRGPEVRVEALGAVCPLEVPRAASAAEQPRHGWALDGGLGHVPLLVLPRDTVLGTALTVLKTIVMLHNFEIKPTSSFPASPHFVRGRGRAERCSCSAGRNDFAETAFCMVHCGNMFKSLYIPD